LELKLAGMSSVRAGQLLISRQDGKLGVANPDRMFALLLKHFGHPPGIPANGNIKFLKTYNWKSL